MLLLSEKKKLKKDACVIKSVDHWTYSKSRAIWKWIALDCVKWEIETRENLSLFVLIVAWNKESVRERVAWKAKDSRSLKRESEPGTKTGNEAIHECREPVQTHLGASHLRRSHFKGKWWSELQLGVLKEIKEIKQIWNVLSYNEKTN